MAKLKKCHMPKNTWESVSSHLVHFVERIFFHLGVSVAKYPWWTIISVWTFLLLSAIGMRNFYIEKNPMKLWVPPESDFYKDTHWFIDKFETGFRRQKILMVSENVLDPLVIFKISEITNQINAIKVSDNNSTYTIQDLCYKIPVVNIFSSNQNSDKNTSSSNRDVPSKEVATQTIDYKDESLWFDSDFYCSFLENFPLECFVENIVDLWKNDQVVISNLTPNDILNAINTIKTNPVTGHPMDYSKILGGIEHDENGNVMKAKSILLTWYTSVNMSEIDINEIGNLVGTEDWVSIPLYKYESEFLSLMESIASNLTDVNVFFEAGRSFGDISGEAMFNELDKLFMGIILMFFYIQFALSRFNWLEIKLTLGSVGLLCVGMAYVTAVSWCSILGIPFGPVHASLPFLFMGLGVDDMFVMKACWEQLTDEEKQKSHPHKVGLMLKHAGVSIVITSFTDIVALLVGAITILPSLKSFCIYAAIGVFFIFIYLNTFYVAVFALDLKRIEANRNGLLFCYKHKTVIRTAQRESVLQRIFSEFYRKVVFKTPVKIGIIMLTVVITGFSIEAMLRLEQRFDPAWFIPEGTYYKEYLDKYKEYYPHEGHTSMVFLGELDYNHEISNIHKSINSLEKEPYVKEMSSWVETFYGYVLANYDHDLLNSTLPQEKFDQYLSKFLFSHIGGRFQVNFRFSERIHCGSPAPKILASSMIFKLGPFSGPAEYIPAMNNIKGIVQSMNITTGDEYSSVWSKIFANWVTDEIIAVEVERNIELALVCVMCCTVILITNLQICMWILICVLLTIINVLGFMQRWGMTVDIVCCIGLELAIGLCVDYAAHVGHTFLTISEGSRSDRAFKTVTSIGVAVMLGGGSTFLSLSLLSLSKAYTFKSFFKIFLLVIVFGLFNGLLFLPTVLSYIGPKAYAGVVDDNDKQPEAVELNGKADVDKHVNPDEEHQLEVPS